MDELYLDNIDEYVNDHNKIVSAQFIRDMSSFLDVVLGWDIANLLTLAPVELAVELRSKNELFYYSIHKYIELEENKVWLTAMYELFGAFG